MHLYVGTESMFCGVVSVVRLCADVYRSSCKHVDLFICPRFGSKCNSLPSYGFILCIYLFVIAAAHVLRRSSDLVCN